MQVHFLLVARHAERALDGALNLLGAGFDYVWVPSLPNSFAVHVAAKVTLDRSDNEIEHLLRVRLLEPSDEVIVEASQIPIPPHQIPPGRDFFNVQFSMGFGGIPLFKEGRYHFELFIDDELVKRTPFRVEKIQQPEQTDQAVLGTVEVTNA